MSTRKSRKQDETNNEQRNVLLEQICDKLLYAESTSANGKIPWGTMIKMIKDTTYGGQSLDYL